jgi:hypothetical protein
MEQTWWCTSHGEHAAPLSAEGAAALADVVGCAAACQ